MGNRFRSLFSHPSYRYAELQNGNIQSAFAEHHISNPDLMKTTNELNNDILQITMRIEDRFPELSKYIDEMFWHTNNTGNLEINNRNLSDYYHSLEALLKNYTIYHGPFTQFSH